MKLNILLITCLLLVSGCNIAINEGGWNIEFSNATCFPETHAECEDYDPTAFEEDKSYFWLSFEEENATLKLEASELELTGNKVENGFLVEYDELGFYFKIDATAESSSSLIGDFEYRVEISEDGEKIGINASFNAAHNPDLTEDMYQDE